MTTQVKDAEAQFTEVLQMLQGLVVSRAIYATAKLGVADLLADGPRSVDDLARATRTHGNTLYRVLRLLALFGLFDETQPRRFSLTALGERLRSDVPWSVRPWAMLAEALGGVRPYDEIIHSVKTGESAFTAAYGTNIWDYFERNSENVDTFDDAMTAGTAALAPQVVANYDFSGFKSIVDLGSGHGTLLAAILRANPSLRGTLVDRPHLCRTAESNLRDAGVQDRVEFVTTDIFEGVPQGADAYVIANVLHNWDDERASELLRLCQRAASDKGKILAIDRVVSDDHAVKDYRNALVSDINMLIYTGGRERTEAEYVRLFELAGLRHTRTVMTLAPIVIMEGVRA